MYRYQQQSTRQPISKTDVLLFQQLANPSRAIVPDTTSKLMQGLHTMDHPRMQQQQQPQPSPQSFDALTQQKYSAHQQKQPNSRYDSGPKYGSGYKFPDPGYDDPYSSYSDDDLSSIGSNSSNIGGMGGPMENSPYDSEFDDVASSNASPYMASSPQYDSIPMPTPIYDPEADRAQRQTYIQELMQLQRDGHKLSIEITDNTPTMALKSEVDLINETINTEQGVERLKFGLRFVMILIEAFNRSILRDFLPLTGWANHTMSTNPRQFDAPLRRIHNMYFRNSFGHPVMQLGMALLFSAGGYVMMQKPELVGNLFGGIASGAKGMASSFGGSSPEAPMKTPFNPAASGMPHFNQQAAQRATQNPGGAAVPKRTVRPPSTGGQTQGTPIGGTGRFPVS